MIDRHVLHTANRIRAAYARYFADMPHTRSAAAWVPAVFSLAYPLASALREARAIERAADLGLTCETETDPEPWDGDCPAPKHLVCMLVRDESGRVLASLGGIGVDSYRDPYLMTCEAELYAEALDTLDTEANQRAIVDAQALASRATYAGVSPEVQS